MVETMTKKKLTKKETELASQATERSDIEAELQILRDATPEYDKESERFKALNEQKYDHEEAIDDFENEGGGIVNNMEEKNGVTDASND
jgi:hypothetical protein